MEQRATPQTPRAGLISGLASILIGALCWHFQQYGVAWLFFAVGVASTITGLFQALIGYRKALGIGTASALIVIAAALYSTFSPIANTNITITLIIICSVFLSLYGFASIYKAGTLRVATKAIIIIAFSITLVFVYHFFSRAIFPLNVILIYLASDNLRRGLYELLTANTIEPPEDKIVFFIPDLVTVILIFCGLFYYNDLVFLHMIAVSFTLSLFRFSTEQFIREIARRERRKIDDRDTKQQAGTSISFFTSLAGTHAGINLLILPLLIGYIHLSISDYLFNSDIHGSVFEVSVGILGIVVAFSALILGERLKKNDAGWSQQTYLLRGLLGITFLFISVAVASFLGVALPLENETFIPLNATNITENLWADPKKQLQILAVIIREFIFFTIPSALLYFFSLNRDMIELFNKENQQENP